MFGVPATCHSVFRFPMFTTTHRTCLMIPRSISQNLVCFVYPLDFGNICWLHDVYKRLLFPAVTSPVFAAVILLSQALSMR